jgi:hypothetical protein
MQFIVSDEIWSNPGSSSGCAPDPMSGNPRSAQQDELREPRRGPNHGTRQVLVGSRPVVEVGICLVASTDGAAGISMRGTGEGHRPFDLQAAEPTTNGTVGSGPHDRGGH